MVISPMSTPASGHSWKRKKCIVDDPMDFVDAEMLSAWNLNDLTAAGKLLRKPPLPCHFDDEHEMRRVYSMIYDVYRCKFSKSFIEYHLYILQFSVVTNRILHAIFSFFFMDFKENYILHFE